jgi:hypothetical protein
MDIFRKIAERKITEAMMNGEFKNLSGKGKRLVFDNETWVPEDLRISYRFLKNAGYLPPELELRNEIINLKSLLNTLDDDKERLKKMRELHYKIMKMNLMRKKPLTLEDFPLYEERIVERTVSNKNS